MVLHSRVLSKDEELGKRDDDFRPRRSGPYKSSSLNAGGVGGGGSGVWRWRRRRVVLVLLGLVGLWLFVRNAPEGLGRREGRLGVVGSSSGSASGSGTGAGGVMGNFGGGVRGSGSGTTEPSGAPPRVKGGLYEDEDEAEKHYHSGPIKFYRLAASLHAISRTFGARPTNRNVLFAASSLKSVANLMPMACEMARWDRNYVHLALMGRDFMSLEDVLAINGVTKEDCQIDFHDARADYSEYSSDHRLEVAVAGGLKHINDFMHPQAIIMDDSAVEDGPFTRAMRAKAKDIGKRVIEVPKGGYEDFLWMTRLDSGSLMNWFKPRIDILVHAPQESSGGLVRLIKSLERADYAGLRPPRLTVELPSEVEYFAQSYLEGLKWPPTEHNDPMGADTLTLRHRIPAQHISSEQASLRFVESFYPAKPEDSHVLILSPQVELSPKYLHYLYYSILEYRYSSYGTPNLDNLMGISLDVPSTFLNGTNGFPLPSISDMNAHKYTDSKTLPQTKSAPFLYQAPSSAASLIFGDKWLTFHSFLTSRTTASHTSKAEKPRKLVSETEPSWTEYLLELMRARDWSLLHPATSFATVHNELATLPEEFTREEGAGQKGAEVLKQSDRPEEEAFLTAPEEPKITPIKERERVSGSQALHESLPFDGDLPELQHLPFLSYTGQLLNFSLAAQASRDFVVDFRQKIGGCEAKEAKRKRIVYARKTDDLFCLPGQDLEFDEEDEATGDAGEKARAIIEEVREPEGKAKAGGGATSTKVVAGEPTKKAAAAATSTSAAKGG